MNTLRITAIRGAILSFLPIILVSCSSTGPAFDSQNSSHVTQQITLELYDCENARKVCVVSGVQCNEPSVCTPILESIPTCEFDQRRDEVRFISSGDCRKFESIDYKKNSAVPRDWIYFKIPETDLELPLPKTANVAANYLSSDSKATPEFFSWKIEKENWEQATDAFLASRCEGVTELFNGRKGNYQGANTWFKLYIDDFEIVKYAPKCWNMWSYLLRHKNNIYVFSSTGENTPEGQRQFEISLKNARFAQ
jgi:hypothetical protein